MVDMKKKSNLILAEKIKAAIAASTKTSKEIADEVGVTPQAIIGWKKSGAISKDSLALFAHAVGMHLFEFIDGSKSTELYNADTQAVLDMMESTDAEGKILAKNAVIEALDKYQARQSKRNPTHSATDFDANLARLLDGIAQVDALAKLDDLRLQIEAKINEQKSSQKRTRQ